jgi:lipoyl(octanoyl) transferase
VTCCFCWSILRSNVIASRELLAERGVELYECDRGGDVTFHGPGQIVGYPIFDLRGHARGEADASPAFRKSLGAVEFVRRLEEVLICTCADFAIPTKRVPGLTGVWTSPEAATNHVAADAFVRPSSSDLAQPASLASSEPRTDECVRPYVSAPGTEAKLAAIGIHISRSVASHGFALNVNTDLSYFNLIIPCGITAKPVTSMQQELGHPLDLNAVAESISRNFGVVFSSQILWVDTLDALLGRTVGIPMKHPAELRQIHEGDTFWS